MEEHVNFTNKRTAISSTASKCTLTIFSCSDVTIIVVCRTRRSCSTSVDCGSCVGNIRSSVKVSHCTRNYHWCRGAWCKTNIYTSIERNCTKCWIKLKSKLSNFSVEVKRRSSVCNTEAVCVRSVYGRSKHVFNFCVEALIKICRASLS